MKKKMTLLAIAPYEGLTNVIAEVARTREYIDLQMYVGDLDRGAKYVEDLEGSNVDLIISRGGTAELIKKHTAIPVIEIKLTEYDILHAIRLAQGYAGKFAAVGFANIIERVKTICQLANISIDTRIIGHVNDVPACLNSLKAEGYSLIVGDTITTTIANQMHMNRILITSSKESVLAAFDEAEAIRYAMDMAQEQNLFYKEVMSRSNMNVFVYNASGHMIYENKGQDTPVDEYHVLNRSILPCLPKVLTDGHTSIMRKSMGRLWRINGIRGDGNYSHYAFFYVRRSIDVSGFDKAISYQDMASSKASDLRFNPLYEQSGAIKPIMDRAHKYANTHLPILIIGEPGTGKDAMSRVIHQNSPGRESPSLWVNCRMLDRKQLRQLLLSENSPFGETGMNIYLKNIQYLDSDACKLLAKYISDTSLHRRNKVVYSSTLPPEESEQNILLSYLLYEDKYSPASLILPSLRERKEDIPSLASIYIHEFNMAFSKQVAGITPESIQLLQAFPWRFNIAQFTKVLRELVLVTQDTFIQPQDTAHVLAMEETFRPKEGALKIEGTLDQIVSTAIMAVLEAEGMNQTKAAKRLGIGRSTMWRKMKANP